MIQSEEGVRYYTDEAAERCFGFSVSKIRTAQRLGGIESAAMLVDGRYVRVWDEQGLLCVYVASDLCEHIGISFVAALGIVVETIDELDRFHKLDPSERKLSPKHDRSFFKDGNVPTIGFINRKHVGMRNGGVTAPLGILAAGRDGRMLFDPSVRELQVTADGLYRSLLVYNPIPGIAEFRALAEKAVDQP